MGITLGNKSNRTQMKIDTYHEAQDLLAKLIQESLDKGHRDIAGGLDEVSRRLQFCWSKTVDREEDPFVDSLSENDG